MLNDHLRSMIYDKYIKPTENRRHTYAGIEIELPHHQPRRRSHRPYGKPGCHEQCRLALRLSAPEV